MKSIIINADDCGYSDIVNHSIEAEIESGRISSTTIMANMPGLDGAVALYKKYSDVVSFGWHINLTEGQPLTKSQILLDAGFYVESNSRIVFNGGAFKKKLLNRIMISEIRNELKAQYEVLRDNGVIISHADSHHHIHTAPGLIMLMPDLFNELHIVCCRRFRTYNRPLSIRLAGQMWAIPFKAKGIIMTDTFGMLAAYYNNPNLKQGKIIELECHPGHPAEKYVKEIEMLHSMDIQAWNAKLITYNDLRNNTVS